MPALVGGAPAPTAGAGEASGLKPSYGSAGPEARFYRERGVQRKVATLRAGRV